MTQPHPQRCETCLNYESSGQWCILLHERIANIEYTLIERVGCASHTSATPTPAAPATEYTIEQIAEIDNRIRKERKSEREKMLDALGWC